MTLAVKGKMHITLDFDEVDTGAGVGGTSSALRHFLDHEWAWSSGTANDTQDRVYSTGSGTVTQGGAGVSYDVAGTLTAHDGSAITLVEVCGFAFRHTGGTGNLHIGAGANPLINWVLAAGDGVKIGPDGMFLITSPTNGFAVTGATGDIIFVDASAGTVTYEFIVWGRTA